MGGCLWVVVALALLSRAVGDGDNDCYVINLAGSIAYYKNTGNRNDPEFTVYTSGTTGLTTPWHGINVGAGAVSAF
jgi:acyl-coenzyme A synthetase/AMP-(fatty) acid ligase